MMLDAKVLPAALAFMSVLSCATGKNVTASDPIVTVSELRKNPESYYGKTITVSGFVTMEFENSNLWVTSEDARKHNCKNAIGVNGADTELSSKFNRAYVVISGVFDTWCPRKNSAEEEWVCVSTGSCGLDEISIEGIYKLK